MNIAVFDVDGTLVRGGTERQFFRWLLQRRHLGTRQLLSFAGYCIGRFGIYGRHIFAKNKAYLNGLDRRIVAEEAAAFVLERVTPQFYPPCIERLRLHQAQGDLVLMLTGTLEPIAMAIAEQLGIEQVIATRCELLDGRYTSAPPSTHPFGADKLQLLREATAELDDPLDRVVAYTDSIWDLALLEAVANPICVNPDRKLRAVALARGWEILDSTAVTAAARPES